MSSVTVHTSFGAVCHFLFDTPKDIIRVSLSSSLPFFLDIFTRWIAGVPSDFKEARDEIPL